MEIKVKNINIYYEETGSGKDVLFLHGWGSSLEVYKSMMSVLSDTCHCVALDFPGCGKSGIMDTPWDTDDYIDLVAEFIQKTGLNNPILVGHSHGGRVVLKATAEGKLNPPKIVLLDAAGLIPKKSFKQKARARSFKIIKGALTLPLIKNYSEDLLNKARRHYGSADYNAAPPVLRQTLVKLVNTDLRNILHNIKCPSLLIWGENDTATPLSDAKIMESLISDSGLCVIKGTGHFSFCEKPYEANVIVKNFLG